MCNVVFVFLHCFIAAEGQSSLVVEKELPPMEEEFPKENGERRSNGTGANYRSDRSGRRQHDMTDDQPGKSRFTFQSCHTSVISYAYHFFKIWYFIKS